MLSFEYFEKNAISSYNASDVSFIMYHDSKQTIRIKKIYMYNIIIKLLTIHEFSTFFLIMSNNGPQSDEK